MNSSIVPSSPVPSVSTPRTLRRLSWVARGGFIELKLIGLLAFYSIELNDVRREENEEKKRKEKINKNRFQIVCWLILTNKWTNASSLDDRQNARDEVGRRCHHTRSASRLWKAIKCWEEKILLLEAKNPFKSFLKVHAMQLSSFPSIYIIFIYVS